MIAPQSPASGRVMGFRDFRTHPRNNQDRGGLVYGGRARRSARAAIANDKFLICLVTSIDVAAPASAIRMIPLTTPPPLSLDKLLLLSTVAV
jgi:hypothetical protein